MSVDIAEAKKICACVPFADCDAGVVETMACMRELITEVESLRRVVEDARKAHDHLADALGMLIGQEKSPTPSLLVIREAVTVLRRATTHLPYLPIGKP